MAERKTASHPLERYLNDMLATRSSGGGVGETSCYGHLQNLFNDVVHALDPKVHCVIQLSNRGAGRPDGGFFTSRSLVPGPAGGALFGSVPPDRGPLEAKWLPESVDEIIRRPQAIDYLRSYGTLLVTNYRDFQLFRMGDNDQAFPGDRFTLAESEDAFWSLASTARQSAEDFGEQLVEFIRRAATADVPLAEPRDVASVLASYARDARARISAQPTTALDDLRAAFEVALGVSFTDEKGEAFFRSTLVQTLFYGVFSSWVLWHREAPDRIERFDWRMAQWTLSVPMVRLLFEQIVRPSVLRPLGLQDLLDWTADALNRVERPRFFLRFEDASAVQYFYEPFLEAFDPGLRKQLGVWYTPPEVVEYMVQRVHRVLQSELGIEAGLADPRVVVLDPCTGTGSFLVHALRLIASVHSERGDGALTAHYVKEAAMTRVFGFELLPAPFVVAHLQIGLLLQTMGVPLDETRGERAGIYLTNALTGWSPPEDPKRQLAFKEMEVERDAADLVKREKPILVVLGNPPYSAFAGVSPTEEMGLVAPYKVGLRDTWNIRKYNLDDLYIRFFSIAQRKIAAGGRGVVCYISNYSFLADPSFVAMRTSLLEDFDRMWIDSLNGDSRETGKRTPSGDSDPSVFSTASNKAGITLGTAVSLFVKNGADGESTVWYRNFWGQAKRSDLLASLTSTQPQYERAFPTKRNRHSLRPGIANPRYWEWPAVVDLCARRPISGLQEDRRGALIDVDESRLEGRLRSYLDSTSPVGRVSHPGLSVSSPSFPAPEVQRRARASGQFDASALRKYALFPLDVRWCYYSRVPKLWNRPRAKLEEQSWEGNRFFVARMFAERPNEWTPLTVTSALPDYHLLRPNAVAIPIRLRSSTQGGLFGVEVTANLNRNARAYLATVGVDPDVDVDQAEGLWMHALAIGHSPRYLRENRGAVLADWPRIPLPATPANFQRSVELGKTISHLLDPSIGIDGVTSGTIRPDLLTIGKILSHASDSLDPNRGDLSVTVGWGHLTGDGKVMPGHGRTSPTSGPRPAAGGDPALNVYINDRAYFEAIPQAVWNFTIGGYQLLKKWLSYRELSVIGRSLTLGEVTEFRDMARRIAAILLLHDELDDSYLRSRDASFDWRSDS